ncbi:nucleotide sugar dehydrogenase, partial [Candidatus Daviesbacteria bacterium]|nr:nucleotide sugar dehydrogenase [Candidatus Daviesbacteria bacterium]
ESTIPPNTCNNLAIPILEKTGLIAGKDISLAHCPERILPGNIYYEIVHNDRIIGGVDEKSCQLAEKVYKSFVKGNIYKTDIVSAELCKLMENSFRDVNIALANEFAQTAKNLGVEARKVIALANKHPRVNILNPGIGVGGHCIPIDPWFIYEVDQINSKLISTSRKINDQVPANIAERIASKLRGIKKPKVLVLGASYKVDSTDTRESPAIKVVKILKKRGITVSHFDPLVSALKYPKTLLNLCLGKDLLVVLVPHKIILREIKRSQEEIQRVLSTRTILQF